MDAHESFLFSGYIAPEYCSQNVYSTKSDVFSFGILVLEIISGKRAVGSYELSGRSYELRRYVSENLLKTLHIHPFLLKLHVSLLLVYVYPLKLYIV